jgi:hypothetical protein
VSSADNTERLVHEQFEAAGWQIEIPRSGRDHGIDLLIQKGPCRYAVQIKYASEPRRPLLEGMLASAFLRARALASDVRAQPLAIVGAPRLSQAAVHELRDFASRYGDGIAWGAVDASGLVALAGPGLDTVRVERRPRPPPSAPPHRSDYFSDLGQWILKVLVSHKLPPELRFRAAVSGNRIDMPVSNATLLAQLAGTSIASAARIVSSLRDAGHLSSDHGALELIRVEQLLEEWRAIYTRRPSESRARWLFAPKDSLRHLDSILKRPQKPDERACLGLFAACDRLGFRFVSGVAPHLYLESHSSDVLRRWGLRPAEAGEAADVMVRSPRFPEALFRATNVRADVPIADIMQSWLDVSENPARGDEMAAHLYARVIVPHLLGGDP